MSSKAIIYSVPGTGSRFCETFMTDVLGYTLAKAAELTENDNQKQCGIIHADIVINNIMDKNPNIKLVTPLRDPYLSFITHHVANSELIIGSPQQSEAEDVWADRWRTLIQETSKYPTAFLPVCCNKIDRKKYLQKIVSFLGVQMYQNAFMKFAEEWPMVGTEGANDLKDEYLITGTILGKKPTFLNFAVDWINTL